MGGKIFLHIIESKKKGVHSIHRELIEHPPLNYLNKKGGSTAKFTDIRKFDFLVPFAKRFLNLTKLPNIWYVTKKCDLIHSAGYLILNRAPWVIDFEMNATLAGFNTNRLNSPIAKAIIKKSLESEYCRKIMPWSEAAAKSLTNYVNSQKIEDKIEVVYPTMCVPPKIKKAKKDSSKTNFLFVGSHFLAKGGKEALKLFEVLDKKYDVDFTIISRIPTEFASYRKRKNIHIHDFVEREKVMNDFFPKADIFLLPTHYDTYGLAMIEAMSCRVPVLSTKLFAVPEIVEDGKTGLLAPAPRVSWFNPTTYQLAYNGRQEDNWRQFNSELMRYDEKEMLKELVANAKQLVEDSRLRKIMGRRGQREVVSGKFSVERRNRQLRRIYEEALGR